MSDDGCEILTMRHAEELTNAEGERPDPEQYATNYPQIAEHIRRTFPVMEVIGESLSGSSGTGPRVELQPRKQLGDFRIWREIGRGGMGVAYEAQQLSMGRTVALKVLPFVALVDDRPLQRFRNEVPRRRHCNTRTSSRFTPSAKIAAGELAHSTAPPMSV